MDFAENFSAPECRESVHGAYWNKLQITLHPMVIYWRKPGTDIIEHKSLIYVSPVEKHSTPLVFAMLKSFLKRDLATLMGGRAVSKIHYITDSPSSQYRNKTSFFLIGNHFIIFYIDGAWHFLEAGHGKGPCDGAGWCHTFTLAGRSMPRLLRT